MLLRYFEWNVDKLYAQYLRQPEQVLQAAGVKVPPASAQVCSSNCLICDEPPSAVLVEKFLSCGHTVVRTYLTLCYAVAISLYYLVHGLLGAVPHCKSADGRRQ